MTDDRDDLPEPSIPDPGGLDPRLQQMQDLAETLRVEDTAADIHEEFDEKLKHYDQRFAQEKSIHEARKVEAEQRQKSDRESTKGLGLGMTLAYAIVGVPVFGYGIGFLVDKSNGTTTYAGIGMLIGCLVGIAVAVLMLSKQK